MYPNGFLQLLEGWSKNLASGARFVPAIRSLLVGLWITALLVAVQLVGLAVLEPTGAQVAVASIAFVAIVIQQRVLLAQLTNARWGTALLFPLTTVFFVAVFVRSIWWTLVRRRVQWRGRTIAVTRADPLLRTPNEP
jgi:4,4'-diaponeurosporenoate glycosyltransferase